MCALPAHAGAEAETIVSSEAAMKSTACVLAHRYSKDGINDFYRWIWNLFYSTYALFPFV